ncbi:MAG: hypothetical protein F6J89_04255 [Symploca sp. SIO1C4]|uniref:Uncharacterized protein n=1 Tax=Symploca sp. SIO1C4 TaxID=2607765 RepID=A0A6B3N5L4_9CYAN|nr:hypothetical protein [Symploca sp. SIO1C4]
MTEQSNIKLTIALSDPELDEEELDEAARKLLQEMNELDEVEQANLVKVEQAPEGSKAIAGFVLGMLEAVVDVGKVPGFMSFLGDRFGGKPTPIEMEVEANGRKLKLKASNQQELLIAIRAAEDFIMPD